MLLGCGMVIGSKAAAAAADIPKAAASSLLPLLTSSAEWQLGNVNAPAELAAAAAPARHVSLWPQRAEEAWLCTAVFGEERGSWLCALGADDEARGNDNGTQGGERQQVKKKKKKKKHRHPHADSGLGMRDVVGICLSLLGAASLAAFMLIVQVGGWVGH
jgi:hypothetical protein